MNPKLRKTISLFLGVTALTWGSAAVGIWSFIHSTVGLEVWEPLSETLSVVKRNYVSPVSAHELGLKAAKGLLKELDPHSQFYSLEETQDFNREIYAKYAGIGVTVRNFLGHIVIDDLFEGGPAKAAGLRRGDEIVAVEGKVIPAEGSLSDRTRIIRGIPNTPVNLTVVRDGQKLTLDIVRKNVAAPSVAYSTKSLGDLNFGYVKVRRFQDRTTDEVRQAVRKGEEAGQDGFILDFRDNPGGLLHEAVGVASVFLPKGSLVTVSKGKGGDIPYVTRGDQITTKPLVVLVNGDSASGSELVALAFRDHGRALVVGQKTFGKGSVQTTTPLDGYGSVKLTTALYYGPKGETLQAKGLTPDVETRARSAGLRESDLPNHLQASEVPKTTGLSFEEDLAEKRKVLVRLSEELDELEREYRGIEATDKTLNKGMQTLSDAILHKKGTSK